MGPWLDRQYWNALKLFEKRLSDSMKPNNITFIGVLFTWIHVGLINVGHHYFGSMIHDHYIQSKAHHCACMNEFLGYARQFGDVEEIIDNLSFKPINYLRACLISCVII